MAVKILHGADFHMDSAFDSLPEDKAAQRRCEQRRLIETLAETANRESVDLVLLSGDLFDSSASYYETYETLLSALSSIKARVFISPGNHDYFCPKSPYAFLDFPENVHIFKTPIITPVEIPELGCRVYGAGFNAPRCLPLMSGFQAKRDGYINIMTIHGDTSGDMYNHISQDEIASSGLDYLALGHIHSYSGAMKAGGTVYAYPGCPEGRGFDETGEKGVIIAQVAPGQAQVSFMPLGGRKYVTFQADVTGSTPEAAAKGAIDGQHTRDIARVILKGVYNGKIDAAALAASLAPLFYHVTVIDDTRLGRDVWDETESDTLTGLFLKRMRVMLDGAPSEEDRDIINAAVKYGLAALENREEWRP